MLMSEELKECVLFDSSLIREMPQKTPSWLELAELESKISLQIVTAFTKKSLKQLILK